MSEENKETTIERIDVEAKITDSRDEEIADLKRQLESANMSLLKTKYRPLLGVDTDITTRREVFVSAIGDQGPEDMDSRSDEYLESWADQLLVRSSRSESNTPDRPWEVSEKHRNTQTQVAILNRNDESVSDTAPDSGAGLVGIERAFSILTNR